MCDIVGYTGKKPAAKILLDSLSLLEYRGCDSTGIVSCTGKAQVLYCTYKSNIIFILCLGRLRRSQGLFV